MKEKKQLTFIQRKIRYSILIALIYNLGRQIPLPWTVYTPMDQDLSVVQSLTESLMGRVSGMHSLLGLGIGPWISASIVMQIIQSFLPRSYKARAQMTLKKITLVIFFLIAVIQATLQVRQMLMLARNPMELYFCRPFAVIALVAGSAACLWMNNRNTKYGLGGGSLLILINVADSFRMVVVPYIFNAATLQNTMAENRLLLASVLYCIVLVFVIILLTKSEIRVPVNRVMIHNVYADKNYMAISLAPAGSMPVMFALTIFQLPAYILGLLAMFRPAWSDALQRYVELLDLNTTFGIGIYAAVFAVLTLVFALVNVDPGEIADALAKSGDTIPGVRAGSCTRTYLAKRLLLCCAISILLLGAGVSVPLFARNAYGFDQRVAMLPSTLMILTGVVLTIIEEYTTLKTFEYYKPFL